MKIPINRARTLIRRVQKKLAPKALILMYHRVAEVELDPWGLCVTPQNFAEQLAVLRSNYRAISLQQLVRSHRQGNILDRSVVITFDDGYADNLHTAKPLLARYDLPATIFISTGCIGSTRELWWDELERLILHPGKLPAELSLSIGDRDYHWNLGEAANVTSAASLQGKPWEATSGSRSFFYHSLWQILLPLSAELQHQALDSLAIWAKTPPRSRATHRTLSHLELQELGRGELIELGAHTVTHPLLSSQSPTVQREEIQRGKIELAAQIDRPVQSFSYPFGNRTPAIVELARAAGFERACSTHADVVWQGSDLFDLPRFTVENWHGERFARQLASWLD